MLCNLLKETRMGGVGECDSGKACREIARSSTTKAVEHLEQMTAEVGAVSLIATGYSGCSEQIVAYYTHPWQNVNCYKSLS